MIEAAQADPRLRLPPVVVCTALVGPQLAAHQPALEACGARLVLKPFDVEVLQAELRAAGACGGPE